MKKQKSIGLKVEMPSQKCTDKNCPFHGALKLRGRIFTGMVIRNVFQKTATLEFQRQFFLKKYERFEKRKTRLKAHVPECMTVKKGDNIRIVETRPISKTKNFVVVEVVKK